MEINDGDFSSGFNDFKPPSFLTLSPFRNASSPAPRRLSSNFVPPNEPVRAARQLAWVSLQGRLIGAEEATSAKAIGGGLSLQEAVAWEMFSPVQRVLVVAVIAVAVANSKKEKEILELKNSVEVRDRVLSAMQEELDSLCEQVNHFKDKADNVYRRSSSKNVDFSCGESFSESINSVGCGCRPCEFHQSPYDDMMGSAIMELSKWEDTYKYQPCEREERRMSNLSDWAPSVNSSVDIQTLHELQLDNEQDIYNLRKECEEKETTIKELSLYVQSSQAVSAKRISELEDIIRRKNIIITKLKKDKMILEQRVFRLTRLQKPFTTSSSSGSVRQLPLLTDNVLYDMANTTSPSSSDSDCPSRNRPQAPVPRNQTTQVHSSSCSSTGDQKLGRMRSANVLSKSADKQKIPQPASQKIVVKKSSYSSNRDQNAGPTRTSGVLLRSTDRYRRSQPIAPLKEKSLNQNLDSATITRSKQSLSSRDLKTRRPPPTSSNNAPSRNI